jgi:putative transposase
VPKGSVEMVAAAVRTIFAQPHGPDGARAAQGDRRHARKAVPEVEDMLRDAATDLLAFTGFPAAHWKRSGRPTRLNG